MRLSHIILPGNVFPSNCIHTGLHNFYKYVLSRRVDLYVRTPLLMLMRVSRFVVAKAVVERDGYMP